MARVWTEAQKQAIDAKGSNLLLAAAAGSGKTAVLVERIIKKITDKENPVDVDKLLVLTFTNAAAAEMRERIMAALTEELGKNPDSEILARQLTLVSKASITTIHSFCNDILRTNFSVADIDPNFKIADVAENELIRIDALEEIIDEMYEDEEFGDDFAQFVINYSSVKNQKDLYNLINSIYSFSMSLPNPKKWILDSCDEFRPGKYKNFNETKWAKVLLSEYIINLRKIISKYDYMIEKTAQDDGSEKFFKQLKEEREMFSELLLTDDYDDAAQKLSEVSFEDAKRVEKDAKPIYRATVLKIRGDVKKDRGRLLEKIFNLSGSEQLAAICDMYPLMRVLSETIIRFIDRFDEKKQKKNLLNFNDLEHKTLSILTDKNGNKTVLAEEIKNKYEEILIDEYQDISRLQEAIFDAVKRDNNLFMVGDMKQSIYRFRNTDPMLFKQKKDEFKAEEGEINRKIILSKNFRSRQHILNCINYIFETIMSEEIGEIDYNDDEKLYFGADFDVDETLNVDVDLIDLKELKQNTDGETIEKVTLEAYIAANKITDLINSGKKIKSGNEYRNITYKDICILMRSTKTTADVFASVLAKFGIPSYSEKSGSLFDSYEIELIMSFLRVIDNPRQDIPLMAVLHSKMYSFSTNDLAKIRIKKRKVSFYEALILKSEDNDKVGKKSKYFLEELCKYRDKAELKKVAELIWSIYVNTGFYDMILKEKNGELKQKNLRLLYIKAEEYEKTGIKGLYNFISFIDNIGKNNISQNAARVIGEEHDVVRIMSIHKSKGLEFPVVILASLGKEFNKQDLKQGVIFHSKLGYGPNYFDTNLGTTYMNGARQACELMYKKEMISEEMRILYVALTRAKEKLILIGSSNEVRSMADKYSTIGGRERKISSFYTGNAETYLEWIIMCLLRHKDGGFIRQLTENEVEFYDDASRFNVCIHNHPDDMLDEFASEENFDEEENTEIDSEKIIKNLSTDYKFIEDVTVPSKVTVTEMKRRMYEGDSDSFYMFRRPDFSKPDKLSAAQKGTVVHSLMEKLDFKSVDTIGDIIAKINELKESGFFTEEEAESINADKVFAFFESEIGKFVKSADAIHKEVMFAINIGAEAVNKDYTGNEEVMLQGIIDCVTEKDGNIFIIDYKTDRVTNVEEIINKYKIQLDLYEKAAEKIYNKTVSKKMLYLFDINESVEVE